MDDETRERKVCKQVDVGGVSRARQTAMPPAPFSGSYQQLLDLFPPKPADEPAAVPPPQDVVVPDCDPTVGFSLKPCVAKAGALPKRRAVGTRTH